MELTPQILKKISCILAELTTGSKITYMFQVLNMDNDSTISTKWNRIYNSISQNLNKFNDSSIVIKVIEYVFADKMHDCNSSEWQSALFDINKVIQYLGLKVNDSGKVVKTIKVETFSDGQKNFNMIKDKLSLFEIHPLILNLCNPEIVEENYFHLILEASKIPLNKVRQLTGSKSDGNTLIIDSFNHKKPLVVLNSLSTQSEKSEYFGLKALLNTIVYFYRNPKAHELKAYNPSSSEDAIKALLMISDALFLLDKCYPSYLVK
ncbi:TIGR02391 family protein [Miniphocaeibacter massiliensis]|uniref:TIGR02391 family protein n=1 Tax=Miniphocaeibacter massiliensis TaxID=2041841 RepID=UPI000C1BD1AE|nr:TIGR02391 family protein [Miniphocaeibacter massiliensis]